MTHSIISGCGVYLPEKILTNADLEKMVDTSEEWIVKRTGIKTRHIAAEGELTSDLAAAAAKSALQQANLEPNDIDLILIATSTPDETLPSTATRVQHKLGISRGAAFDLQAACSGFVYGLAVADSMLKSGLANRALVIGAETFSRIVDWTDRSTCILFGDGAGAMVLEAVNCNDDKNEKQEMRGILHSVIHSDGAYGNLLRTSGGISTTGNAGTLTMSGKEVFRHAVEKMGDALQESLHALNISATDLDWIIPHQANYRILQTMAHRLEIAEEKLVATMDRHANTSAASIPLSTYSAIADGRIKSGNLIAFPALGAGLTWGNCIIRW